MTLSDDDANSLRVNFVGEAQSGGTVFGYHPSPLPCDGSVSPGCSTPATVDIGAMPPPRASAPP